MRKQATAHDRLQECQEHEVTPLENVQCDDQFELDYASRDQEEENLQDIPAEEIDSDDMGPEDDPEVPEPESDDSTADLFAQLYELYPDAE